MQGLVPRSNISPVFAACSALVRTPNEAAPSDGPTGGGTSWSGRVTRLRAGVWNLCATPARVVFKERRRPGGSGAVGPSLCAASFGILSFPPVRSGETERQIRERGRAQRGPTKEAVPTGVRRADVPPVFISA